MTKRILTGLSLAALMSTAAFAAPGRLPADVVPTAYDLTIDPDAKALTFNGSGSVAISVTSPTRTITVNAVDLSIRDVKLDGTIPATVTLNAPAQTATFTFATPVAAGNHRLAMVWSGKIYQSATGMFAIDYTNLDGTPDRMLATQFEAPDARRFAPMWDEPGIKATVKLSALAPTGQMAFSNMPVESKAAAANGKTIWHFAATPKMSSYLMFLGIGNVERKTVMAGKTEIGIITRKGVVDQGDYALASAKRILAHYNDYFGTPYPLPKMDMIAGPGSSQFFGAMENWGAIFYFERVLLLDPKLQTESQKQDVFDVVAHEMAHQWFGDLVTMAWWDDLWLNEGFASWMASKTANDLNPDWGALTQSVAFARQSAMSRDARVTTHPIIAHVETPDQVSDAFDDITYRKGEAVIRMLEGAVGPDKFREGVRRYMAKHKYGNTVTDDLWTEVSAASGTPVKPMMDSFTRQGGVPLVSFSDPVCAGGNKTLSWTGSRWGLDAQSKAPLKWIVPVNVAHVGATSPIRTIAPIGSTPVSVTVPGCGLVVVNYGQSSYYRSQYTPKHFERLRNNFATLGIDDQVGLLADSYALANSNDQPIERYLSLVDSVGSDARPAVWALVATQLAQIDNLLKGTAQQAPFRAKARRLLTPQLAKLGWLPTAGESPQTAQLREDIVPVLGRFGDEKVQQKARGFTQLSFATPDAVKGSVRQAALAIYAYNATGAQWDTLHQQAKSERSPVARLQLYTLLGSAHDAALAQRALDLTLTDEIPVPMRGNVIQAVSGEHPALAFDWAVAHADQVSAFLEASTRARFIVGLPSSASDIAVADRVNAYSVKFLPESSRKPAANTVAVIKDRAERVRRLSPAIAAWAAS